MQYLRLSILSYLLFFSYLYGLAGEKDYVQYVNPLIGTQGDGHCFPGAVRPLGMVQPSPETTTDHYPGYEGDHISGYQYSDPYIWGITQTHLNGVGCPTLSDILLLPFCGDFKNKELRSDFRSEYRKDTEQAYPGYYSVELTDYRIKVESSATPHCGILRFTYPSNKRSRIQIDLARRVGGTSTSQYIKVVDEHTIQGWMKCTPDGGGWGNGEGKADYTVYYYAQFSKPLADYGFWSADIPEGWVRKRDEVVSIPYLTRVSQAPVIKDKKELEGKHLGFFTEFPTKEGETVEMKVGISFVDMEGATNNFKQEIASKDLEQVKKEATDLWNKELSRIRISGGTEDEKTIFYTAMYHTMIDPRIYTDVDGRYVGGDYKIHTTDSAFTKRTIFSGWDVFRSQFPLQTIINPCLVSDELNSLISMAEQSGREYYERWEFLNSYSGCMLGNPALSVLADAYVKGIRTYDVEKAYRYAVNTSRHFGNDSLGYIPEPLSISTTLEYAYTDWCISQVAQAMGKNEDARYFYEKGQAYHNIFDKEKGWFRPRKADGSWVAWPENARLKEWYGCIEANSYQQGWFVPHDVSGMVELMGGKEKVIEDLIYFFSKTPSNMLWNEYYNHANEPVHFVPFLFNQLAVPWHTQKWTRYTCEKAYANKVEGIVGNEDVGQMSAWYVLAASGIHPSCPGNTRMEITSPVFDKVEFALDPAYYSGKKFTVIAHDNSVDNVYIQKALLNGKEYNKCYLDFTDIVSGGTLELFMGDTPNKEWGI